MTDLVIAGGLTIDRFADGSTAPGGSVLHAGAAAVAEGLRPTLLTVAGDEPEARAGLSRLAEIGTVHCQAASTTTRYRHEQVGERRVLVHEVAGGQIRPEALGPPHADVLLLAPIADELPAGAMAALRAALAPRLTVLLIQGWLRRLVIGEPVHPIGLDDVAPALWELFGDADVIVVSTEDLTEAHDDPFAQAAALRTRLGGGPLMVLTLGSEGYLLDDPAADRITAAVPRRVITGVPTVGAGDTFGAALAIHLAGGATAAAAAEAGTERVIALLESRRASI